MSDLERLRNFYKNMAPDTYTPDAAREALYLKSSAATIGRKCRLYAKQGMLIKSYYRNHVGEEIAEYSWNPNYGKPDMEQEAKSPELDNNGEEVPNPNPEHPNDEPENPCIQPTQETLF